MAGIVGRHGRAKQALAQATGLDHATLHVHVGLAIWVACVLIAGSAAAVWPLVVVLALELANEGFDRLRTGSWRWRDTVGDIINSVLWPAILFGLARIAAA